MISVHRAFPEDADQLTRITIAAKRYWDYSENWMQLWIPALTISSQYLSENEAWLAAVDEKPVAYYSFILNHVVARSGATKQSRPMMRGLLRAEDHRPRNDIDSLWLDNLWVLPELMGQGIGQKLFKHALERSRVRGFSILKIEADPNAQSFYEKMGARQIGEHHSEVDGQARVLPVMEVDITPHI